MFELNETIKNDTILLGNKGFLKILLAKDSNYPWIIVVPEIEGLTELYQLREDEFEKTMKEIAFISRKLKKFYEADKINVANIGNVVDQLHIHVVARFKEDKAWPAPIWGHSPFEPYSEKELNKRVFELKQLLYLPI